MRRGVTHSLIWLCSMSCIAVSAEDVRVGFAEVDITPDPLANRPVWLAGYGHGRQATGVHDPLSARCMVLCQGEVKIALVSVDLVGLQYPEVQRIRERLPDYRYVLVASTHNHEGPDVIGIWGKTPVARGVDDDYLGRVVERCEEGIRAAERDLTRAHVGYGTAEDESLLADRREPYVKDGVLRVLRFERVGEPGPIGLVVQWNCHPESLGSRNTLITADFPHFTAQALKREFRCPIVYLSGAVGGLMTYPDGKFQQANGEPLGAGNFEYARQYGEAVAQLASRALQQTTPVQLTPLGVYAKKINLPIQNQYYRAAQELGVLARFGKSHTGDAQKTIESEVAYMRLGEIHLACIPGEIYPELVYGKVQSPADPGADFPDAAVEPAVTQTLPGPKWLLVGLANDELGYIVPKRQWDEKPPFCYGRPRAQYGEVNSCGPETAPIILNALAECVANSVRAR